MLRTWFCVLVSTACFGLGLMGCAKPKGPIPVNEVLSQYQGPVRSSDTQAGQQAFNQACSSCHGPKGDAPDLQNLNLTPGQVRMQVREGRGDMPAIPPAKLSDAALENVLAYIATNGTIQSSPAATAPTSGGEATE